MISLRYRENVHKYINLPSTAQHWCCRLNISSIYSISILRVFLNQLQQSTNNKINVTNKICRRITITAWSTYTLTLEKNYCKSNKNIVTIQLQYQPEIWLISDLCPASISVSPWLITWSCCTDFLSQIWSLSSFNLYLFLYLLLLLFFILYPLLLHVLFELPSHSHFLFTLGGCEYPICSLVWSMANWGFAKHGN